MSIPGERAPTRQITLICEMLTGPAGDGRLVGRIHVVATGETVPITDVDELLALLRRLAAGVDPPPWE